MGGALVRTADTWRYLSLALAAGTTVAGAVWMNLGGPRWPCFVGAVACLVLGEFWWHYDHRKPSP
jgi:hypothetical protein